MDFPHSYYYNPKVKAVIDGDVEKVCELLQQEETYDVDSTVTDGCTLLMQACKYGQLAVVRVLVEHFKADLYKGDMYGNIPLLQAAFYGHMNVVVALLRDFHCPVLYTSKEGEGVLHKACFMGHIDLVRVLIHEHNAKLDTFNNAEMTPFHLAMLNSRLELALCLVFEFGCDPNLVKDAADRLLVQACEVGNVEQVRALISRHKADPNTRDWRDNTPLHAAAKCGSADVVLALISEFSCDPNAIEYQGRSPLLLASVEGHGGVVQALLECSSTSLLLMDHDGNTALHLASGENKLDCVMSLVHANAPLTLKNKKRKTPVEVATGQSQSFLKEHVEASGYQIDYNKLLKSSKKLYEGSHHIIRAFVLGNTDSGKSSLIESLKKDGFFESLRKVSVSRTAGVVPSVHVSKESGRVLFYDFSGNPDYYSSHAAIIDCLASSRRGTNIFIIVVDLRGDSATILTTLHYWFAFLQHQKVEHPLLLVVGSHSDTESGKGKCDALIKFITLVSTNVNRVEYFTLDCRTPRSTEVVRQEMARWVSESPKHEMSIEASLLLAVLQKDCCLVPACPVQTLVTHIRESGLCIPSEPDTLHAILLELHEMGLLLLLGSNHVVLDISKFTVEVHRVLFSESGLSCLKDAHPHLPASAVDAGILPKDVLTEVLESLTFLQYCQEISQKDKSFFPALQQAGSNTQPFFFIPALCSVEESQLTWGNSTESSNIGWLALCSDDSHDYFPPRFLHILLLRLVHAFLLCSPQHGCHCTMWKRGVQWSLENGVDCRVELVIGSKGVVVLTTSPKEKAHECTNVLANAVRCVMEVKAEFCRSVKPQFYFLDSCIGSAYLRTEHRFPVSDVQSTQPLEKGEAVGREREEFQLLMHQCISKLTYWNVLFPIGLKDILHALRGLVGEDEVLELGGKLGTPSDFLDSIKASFPCDMEERKRELIQWWMSSTRDQPCWWKLVEALKASGCVNLAEEMTRDHDSHMQLQEQILDPREQTAKPDEKFLRSLSREMGITKLSPRECLSLTEDELTGNRGLSQEQLAFRTLSVWASSEEATYQDLYHKLTTTLILT